jgi:beta-aspartyl-dipeptidase (metallo-type)
LQSFSVVWSIGSMPGVPSVATPTRPLTLIRGGDLVLQDRTAASDLLIANGKIVALGDDAGRAADLELVDVHDVSGHLVAPGLVDAHVHFLGGGGGDGFSSRIPELSLTDFTANGITTAVGAPGIDMVSRSADGLLAKSRGLSEEGMTGFLYVGGFHRPLRTFTGSPWRDAYLVPEVIGLKLAVGEPRAPGLTDDQLVDFARELLWVGRATQRGGVLHIHLGLEDEGVRQLRSVVPRMPDPGRVVITHCNYSPANLEAAIDLAPTGVRLDVTTMLAPSRGIDGAVEPAAAVIALLDAGVAPEQLSMSTDGNGSPTTLNDEGDWAPYRTHMDSLVSEMRAVAAARDERLALALVSRHPADALRLDGKGRITLGADADLVVLNRSLEILHTYARGRRVVAHGSPVIGGRFDNKVRAPGGAEEGA